MPKSIKRNSTHYFIIPNNQELQRIAFHLSSDIYRLYGSLKKMYCKTIFFFSDWCYSYIWKSFTFQTDTFGKNIKTNNTDKTELDNKIPDSSGLVKKNNYNTKITELENKIADISNLATKTALTAIENKIPSVSNLVKKADYNSKVTDIENKINNHNHDKYIDT